MVTRTTLTSRGQLRHGHPLSTDYYSALPLDWHAIDAVHDNPEIHEYQRSFTEPNWTTLGLHWENTKDQCDALITDAKASHDRKQAAMLAARDAFATPTATAAPAQSTPTQDLTELNTRIDNAEALALMAHGAATDATKAADDVAVQLVDAANVIRGRHTILTDNLDSLTTRVTELEKRPPLTIHIRNDRTNTTSTLPPMHHYKLPLLIELAAALEPGDRNIWLSGPAGSGKTTAVKQVAKALGLSFAYMGAIDSSYKISGFMNANGVYIPTHFRTQYENGGVFLWDEVDGSSPSATMEANGAIANGEGSFPDVMVPRHDTNYLFAAGNTWGFGGDSNYVGRMKQDAAFLDRFVTVHWPYDTVLERTVANLDEWVDVVHEVRKQALKHEAEIIVGPRASIKGAQLLRGGLSPSLVVEAIFGKFRDIENWSEIGRAAEDYAKRHASTTRVTAAAAANKSLPSVDLSNARVFNVSRSN